MDAELHNDYVAIRQGLAVPSHAASKSLPRRVYSTQGGRGRGSGLGKPRTDFHSVQVGPTIRTGTVLDFSSFSAGDGSKKSHMWKQAAKGARSAHLKGKRQGRLPRLARKPNAPSYGLIPPYRGQAGKHNRHLPCWPILCRKTHCSQRCGFRTPDHPSHSTNTAHESCMSRFNFRQTSTNYRCVTEIS